MDFQNIFEKCVVVGIDVFFMGLFYKLYKTQSNTLKSLKAIQCMELDQDLSKKIQDSGGTISYAAVTGKVKAISTPLQSEHLTDIRGVIREKIVKEYKATWIPFLRMWNTTDSNITRHVASVPFGLYNRTSFFKKPVFVEIVDPFLAQELVLHEVYNDFKSHEESLGEAVIGLIIREHTLGTQEIENVLLEDTSLTAVGKLVIENSIIKMMPPDGGLRYFITPLSYNALTKKVSTLTMVYKGLTGVMCIITFVVFSHIIRKGYAELKKKISIARDMKRRQEARKLERSRSAAETDPKCVVCLENLVEIVILECGHACLCLNCAERVRSYCPVCRSDIQRLVPVYMP